MKVKSWIFVLVAALSACGADRDSDGEPDAAPGGSTAGGPLEPFPDKVCPGSEGCTGIGDGALRVGAARVSITPSLVESEWDDANGNHVFDSTEDFTDVNGNGVFDATWIAGSQNGRAAIGVHDDLWARAIVFERNDVRVAILSLDLIGWFYDDVEAIRARLSDALQIDHVIVAATHDHQSPDTMGLWGMRELESGVIADYNAQVQAAGAQAVADAVAELRPALMTVAQDLTVDEEGSARPYVGDVRDPVIFDPTITVLRFAERDAPSTTIATLVHWAAHPEYVWFDNNLLSSDYVHYLRETVEQGAPEDASGTAESGLGGEVVFVNGAIGGQVGPIVARPVGPDGEEIAEGGFAKAEAAGTNVGRIALQAISDSELAEDVADPAISFRTGAIEVSVENVYYHVGAIVGVFDREFHGHDPDRPLGEDNIPFIYSRVSYLQIGPVAIVTCPGELHPELFIGGYDGSQSWGQELVSADNPNPPVLANAPQGPYLRDIMLADDGVRYALVLSNAEDTLGYVVPEWNYVLDETTPYLEEAAGDHYEETNSVGPKVEREVVGSMRRLIEWGR